MTYEEAIKKVEALVLRLGTEKEKAEAERDAALAEVARLKKALYHIEFKGHAPSAEIAFAALVKDHPND